MSKIDDIQLFKNVVDGGYCIGCGVCSVVSNSPVINKMDTDGRFQAILKNDGVDEESAFMSVCPFSGLGLNEDQLSDQLFENSLVKDNSVGKYINNYVGHVVEGQYRINGSSGGMGTWVLKELFSMGLIDKVLHVQKGVANERLFQYGVSSTIEEIENSSKSRYYPIELSEVLDMIKSTPGKYAIVGVPCFVKAVRLLCNAEEVFNERIKFCIGLVCGHLKSKNFTEMIGMQLGFENDKIESINFREKLLDRAADDYGVKIIGTGSDGVKNTIIVPTKELFGTNWGYGFFKYNACEYCDDVFAETADITVGDAWIPKYVQDSNGTNVIVVRNQLIDDLIKKGIKDERLCLENVPASIVAKSQLGGLRHRRDGLAYRLYLKDQKKQWRPVKRVIASKKMSSQRKKVYEFRMQLIETSFAAYNKAVQEKNFGVFVERMNPILKKYTKVQVRPLWKRVISKGIRIITNKNN